MPIDIFTSDCFRAAAGRAAGSRPPELRGIRMGGMWKVYGSGVKSGEVCSLKIDGFNCGMCLIRGEASVYVRNVAGKCSWIFKLACEGFDLNRVFLNCV